MNGLELINVESIYEINTLGSLIVHIWIALALLLVIICVYKISQSQSEMIFFIFIALLIGELILTIGMGYIMDTYHTSEQVCQKYSYQIVDNSMQEFFNDYEVVSYDDTTKILTVMEKNN